jgi:alpha-ribazole phosphatase
MHLPPHDGATRLLLIRHLQPDASVSGRAYGSLDVPLSPSGRQQAEELARALEDIPLAAVYTSPLRRALETASPIAGRHGLDPLVHDGLRELDFGRFEGERYEDLERRDPATFRAWMSDPTGVRFPGGEAFSDLLSRVMSAADEVRNRHHGSCVAVVAHGGVTRAILAAALELPAKALFRLDQPYGALSVIDWFEATPVVRVVNADPLHALGGRA